MIYFLSSSLPQRPQAQIADRHQIDDLDASNRQRLSLTSSRASNTPTPTASASAITDSSATTDQLGPLPSGWQVSKTENGRLFFIDHINKRTTWVNRNLCYQTPHYD